MGSAFKLTNGSILISTEAPGGLYNAAQLKKIAALCDSDAAVVRATEDQRIALFVHDEQATKVVSELRSVGLGVRNYQEGLHQPISCVGVLCSEHKQDALSAAMEISESLGGEELSTPLKIGINGCGKCCVATHTLDVSLVGEENGYKVGIGGKNAQIPEMASLLAEGVPGSELPALMTKLITAFRNNAEAGERLQETIERVGTSSFVEAFAPYSQDAAVDNPFAANDAVEMAAEAPATVEQTAEVADEQPAAAEELASDAEPSADEMGDLTLEEPASAELESIDSMDVGAASEEVMGDAELSMDAQDSGEVSVADGEQAVGEQLLSADADLEMTAEPDVDLSLDDVSAAVEPDLGEVSLEDTDSAIMSPEVAEVAAVNEDSTNITAEHLDDMQLGGVNGEESMAVDSALGDHVADMSLESNVAPEEELVAAEADLASEVVAEGGTDEIVSIDTSGIEPEEVNLDDVNLSDAPALEDVELEATTTDLASSELESAEAESGEVSIDMEPEIIAEDPVQAQEAIAEIATEEHHDDLQLDLVPEDSVGIEDHAHAEPLHEVEAAPSDESGAIADEAQLEDDINLDIDAEASVPADSDEEAENAADRLETLRLVKTSNSEESNMGATAKLDPLMDRAMIEDDLDVEFNDDDAAQLASDLNEIGAASSAKVPAVAPTSTSSSNASSGGNLTDVSSTRDGGWKLSFANGMAVEISAADLAHGARKLTLAGVRIELEVAGNEVKIKAGGISISMPRQKAA